MNSALVHEFDIQKYNKLLYFKIDKQIIALNYSSL